MKINKEKWIENLQNKRLSDKTIKDYCGYFDKFDFEKLSRSYINKWINEHNHGPGRAFINNLLEFILNQDVPQETKEWVRVFKLPKQTGRKKKRVLNVITKEQVHQLAKHMNPRERYMTLLTFFCGLRSAELLSLTIDSFDWKNSQVRVIGKGDKERVLPVVPQLRNLLVEWVNENIEKSESFNKLFDLSPRYWRKQLEKYSKKYLNLDVNPHLLRHSCGSYLHEQGLDLKEIAEFLGHDSVETTQIYVHLNKEQLNNRVLDAFG